MHAFRIWVVLRVLASASSSLRVNEIEYDGFADNYGNEISIDQQQEESLNTPYHADLSRWDKLFIALENSHMRQKMLLESVEQCCGGMVSLKTQLDKLLRGVAQQSAPSLVSACSAQAQQEALRLHQSLTELQQDGVEMERRINATLQTILHSRHEDSARLSRLEEAISERSRSRQQPTQRPGGLSRTISGGVHTFQPEQEDRELSSQVDLDMIKGSLVVVARDVQRVYLELHRVIEQTGTLRKGRGDT